MTSVGVNDALPEEVVGFILSFLDVPTLVQDKAVCQSWEWLCIHTIDQKVPTPQAFQSHDELKTTANKYMKCNAADAEEIATTYGWSIDRWDVSKVEDFTGLFRRERSFNEDIGSWGVSKAICMTRMFAYASAFNQDISSWNTTHVKDMNAMFEGASKFNRDISSWNMGNTESMNEMFRGAISFNQGIGS